MTDATVDQGASVDKSTVAATSQPEAASKPTKAPTTTTEPKSEGGKDTERECTVESLGIWPSDNVSLHSWPRRLRG